jgi:hypothetical protein
MDILTQGYQQFESITVNVGDQIQFYNGTGGTYNFWVADNYNSPAFEEPGISNGQLIYSVVIDPNYPSYNYIRVEEYVFSPTRIKEIEISKNTAGVTEEAAQFNIYPNPTTEKLYLDAPNSVESVSIFSLEGGLVSTHAYTNEINVSHLSDGIYLFTGNLEDGSVIQQKFIKK